MPRLSIVAAPVGALAALMLLAAPALAQETRSMAGVIPGYEPSPMEQGLVDIEARMARFAAQVEALDDDESLTPEARGARMAELWREYGPDIITFSASAAEMGLTTAGTMMESMNIGAIVGAALSQVDLASAMASVEVQAALAEAFAEMQTAFAEAAAEAAHDAH